MDRQAVSKATRRMLAMEDRTIYGGWPDMAPSWYCEPCAVEVYERRCPHCGKLERDTR